MRPRRPRRPDRDDEAAVPRRHDDEGDERSPARRRMEPDPEAAIRRQVEEELAFHVDMRVEALVRAGLSGDEARRRVLEEAGDLGAAGRFCARMDLERERSRGRARRLAGWGAELRAMARAALRKPSAVAGALLVLTAAIALNTLVFTVVRAVLLAPLPLPRAPEMVVLREHPVDPSQAAAGVSYPAFRLWRDGARGLDGAVAWLRMSPGLAREGEAVVVEAAAVTAGFLPFTGLRPVAGRGLRSGDHAPQAERVAVLSRGLWERAFGADPGVVGSLVELDRESVRVVGVVDGSPWPEGAELWIPVESALPDLTEVWGARILSALGRTTTQASQEATAELEAELGTLASDIPDMARWRAEAVPLEESLLRDVRRPLAILQGAVALVLVIACANVGILLSVRGMRRRGDAAVRKALGASRARLAAMGLVESVGLSALAGALGLGAAALALEPALQAVPAGFPRASEVDLHGGVALFALAMALGTGLVSGAAPAAQAWAAPVAPTLNEAGSGRTPSRGARRIRAAAVAGQVALSVVLLAAAGVLTRSFLTVLAQDPGFRPDGIVTFDLSLNGAPYEEPSAQLAFVETLLVRLEALARTDVAAVARNLPVSGSTMTSPVDIEGRGATPEPAQIAWVSPGYFRLMGVPVLDGRAFGADDGPEGRPVAMVDEAFARRFLPGEAAVGSRARSYFGASPPREVVGVAGAVRHGGLTEAPPPVFYEPFLQAPSGQLTLLVRSTAPTGAVVADVRAVLRGLDPALPVRAVATMDERIGRSVATHRFYASVLAGFAAFSLLLTMVGSYSVLSHSVAERRREIGIRLALGAPACAVRGEVIRQALGVTLIGLVVGTSGALLATRALRGLLFGVGPADPLVLASLPVLLAAAALAAAWQPARRATAVDPAGTLRDG